MYVCHTNKTLYSNHTSPLQHTDGISIGSSVFAKLIAVRNTHRHVDRQTDRQPVERVVVTIWRE